MSTELFIPFRCPNCGDSRKFETLHELRKHLEHEHSYQSSSYRRGVVPSSPVIVSRLGRHSPLMEMFHNDAQKIEESLRRSKEQEMNNKRRRSGSSDLYLSNDSVGNLSIHDNIHKTSGKTSFREYGHPSRLQKHYQPSRHLPRKYNKPGLQTNDIYPYQQVGSDASVIEPTFDFDGLYREVKIQNVSSRPFNPPDLTQRHIQDTISALSNEVLLERENQHATAKSLFTAQEVLFSVEQAAELKVAQQKNVIEVLADKLKEKESKLSEVVQQVETLSKQQITTLEKVALLKQHSDMKAELLQKKLDKKQNDFDTLNQKLFEIQQSLIKGSFQPMKQEKAGNDVSADVNLSSDSIQQTTFVNTHPGTEKVNNYAKSIDDKMSMSQTITKDKEIKKVKNKAQQLERDRQNLLIEMQNLLESAAADNEKLQSELASQSQELSQLNLDLEHSKQEQAEILSETSALYHQADVSLAKLKTMLKDRENEVKNVSVALEQARATQVKLSRERDECLKRAEEREAKYMEIMTSNTQQVKSMKKTLEMSLHEKQKLEAKMKKIKQELDATSGKDTVLSNTVSHLKSALENKIKSQAKLKEELRKREEKLRNAKHEMRRMTRFLKDTAEKEMEARSKLEDFISGLIDRAGKAEAELQRLKESYRLQQSAADSIQKHKKGSNVLDLSSLPGASTVIEQSSFDLDNESTASFMVPSSHYNEDSHYQSTPKTLKQAKSKQSGRKHRTDDYEWLHKADVHKSMKHHKYLGDGNNNNPPDLPNISVSQGSEESFDSVLKDDDYDSDGQQGDQERNIFNYSHNTPEKLTSRYEESKSLHASPLVLCSEKVSKNENLRARPTSVKPLNVAPKYQSPLHDSPISKSQHVVSHLNESPNYSMPVSLLLPGSASTALPQHLGQFQIFPALVYPLLISKTCNPNLTDQTSILFPYTKDITGTRDNNLITDLTPVVYNVAPQAHNSILVEPYNSSQHPMVHIPGHHHGNDFDANLYTSYLNTKESSLFKNIPEVENMFANVFNDAPSLTEQYSRIGHRGRMSQKTTSKEDMFGERFSLDEDGIMWESKKSLSSKYSSPEQYKNIDDTDIDEDISDYIVDAQPTFQTTDESSLYFNVKKRTPFNAMKPPLHTDEPLPLDLKMAKIITSTDAQSFQSSARDNYYRYMNPQNSQPKLSSNDYKSEESMADGPLHKAKMVQKRLEHFTNVKPRHVSSSRQSEGFDISQMDSDLSISSYQSICAPNRSLAPKKPNLEVSDIEENIFPKQHLSSTDNKVTKASGESNYTFGNAKQIQHTQNKEHGINYLDFEATIEKKTAEKKQNVSTVYPNKQINHEDNRKTLQNPIIGESPTFPASTSDFVDHQDQDLHCADKLISTSLLSADEYGNETSSKHLSLPVAINSHQDNISHNVKSAESQANTNSVSPFQNTKENHFQSKDDEMHQTPLAKTVMAGTILPGNDINSTSLNSTLKFHETQPTAQHFISTSTASDHKMPESNPSHQSENRFTQASDPVDEVEEPSDVSSEEDYIDEKTEVYKVASRKESVDASTDTDLEKLAKPGYTQKGLVVRKNIPTVKHIRKKKMKKKPVVKRTESEESLETTDMDDAGKEKRHKVRRKRVALFRIFSYLDIPTLLTVSRVCKEWCKVSRHPALWKVVKLENRAISSTFLNTLSQWCTKTQSLTLKGLTGHSINENESSEEYIQSIRGSLEGGLEKLLSVCQNTITQLAIDNCDHILTDKCLWLVSGYCRLLTKLTYNSSVDPISPQLMWALGGGCPGITSLFIQPKPPFKVNGMNNRSLLLISQFYKDLEEIGFSGKEFDSAGLISLVQSCQRLRVINFEYCLPMTSDLATKLCKAGLKNLHTLTIIGMNVEVKALQTLQGNSRQLKNIVVKIKIADCVTDPSKKKDKETYKKIVKALEGLKSKPGFGNIFTLEAGPAE